MKGVICNHRILGPCTFHNSAFTKVEPNLPNDCPLGCVGHQKVNNQMQEKLDLGYTSGQLTPILMKELGIQV